MRHILFFVSLFLFTAISGMAETPELIKEPYRLVQVIPEGEDFHYDGANLTRYHAFTVYTDGGFHVLDVPESISKPHIIRILPGTYLLEFSLNNKTEKVRVVVDNDSFQQFRIK